VSHDVRAGIEPDESHAPRQVLPEIRLMAVKERGFRNQLPRPGLQLPFEIDGQAPVACFARWILQGQAARAPLQLKAAKRSSRSQPQRNPAALARRQWR
jgi:hypothetical protein